MKHVSFALIFVLASLMSAASQSIDSNGKQGAPATISSDWFAMHAIAQTDPWPTQENIQFSSWRSVSAGIDWGKLNPSPGVYEWTYFDRWMSRINQYGQTVLYTVYYTPVWASQCPTCTCNAGNQAPGGCYPPNDLNADGTGSDQHLKDFVTALLQHVGPGKIQYLEVWNEPNNPSEWGGTTPQLVSMTRDIRAIAKKLDANIKIICPPETGDGKDGLTMVFLGDFLAAGGGQYVDIIGLHGYVIAPEQIITRLAATTAVMQQYGQTGKPIYVTEGSWFNGKEGIPAPNQPGFSMRLVLSMLSTPTNKFYLYAFESPYEGNLWDPNLMKLTANATTYQLYYSLLVGATMTQPCQAKLSGQKTGAANSVWTCTFTKPGGYQAQAIWNSTLPLGQKTSVNVSSQFVQYRDVYGKVFQIKNNSVPVGYNPIWLEN